MTHSPDRLSESSMMDPTPVLILEARSGRSRRGWLEAQQEEARSQCTRTWLLSVNGHEGGPWAGLDTLFGGLIEDMLSYEPDLVRKHDYELSRVLPQWKARIGTRYPTLTDLASPQEKVRNYPADRAFRSVHGLIDLLSEWKTARDNGRWWIACDDYDRASHMGRYFFQELMRRKGKKFQITLCLAIAPDTDEIVGKQFLFNSPVVRVDLAIDPVSTVPREEIVNAAEKLEQRVRENPNETEVHLPGLIHAWQLAGRPERAFKWQVMALDLYNSLGLYEDALPYGQEAREALDQYAPEDDRLKWSIFNKLFGCYVGLKRPLEAFELATTMVIGKLDDYEQKSQLCYLIAMLYARHLPTRDLTKAEEYLEQGLRDLAQADMPWESLCFQRVFNRNGLALVRHFQGRYQEAIDLCRLGYEQLHEHLGHERHRLHRSVLLYNMAQVYTAIGAHEEAIQHFSMAMELDPNYSEYYNERGNIYLKSGNHEAALTDYKRAIELSPPYHEVWTNLGQSYRLLKRLKEAVETYSVAIDLEPMNILALLGRAQSSEALGYIDDAINDYNASLILDPKQWEAMASRAVLQYQAGKHIECLLDLNDAIALAPGVPDLYHNRSIVSASLGHFEDAARDLSQYLKLQPDTEDRTEIETRLYGLRNSAASG